MAIYFMGGEDIDFNPLGTVSINTGSTFRTDFARCSLAVNGGTALSNGWRAAFSGPASAFWMGMRVLASNTSIAADPGQPLVMFSDGGAKRFGLMMYAGGTLAIGTWDGNGVFTKLMSSAAGAVPQTLFKLDMNLTYAASGGVRVFVNQTEVITYVGNTLSAGSSTLNGFQLGSPNTDNSQTYFSEVFITDRDSRTLMLKTHAPAGDANGNQWTGNYQQIGEVVADEATVISTNSNDQSSNFTITGLPSGTNLAIRGFKVSGYAARGETGPQHLDLAVTTNGTTTYSPDVAVDTGWTRVGQVWEQNPVTNAAWAASEINALSIGVKSKA